MDMQAKPGMTKSTVVDNETGKSVDSTVRTSTGTFFNRGEDEVIRRIEKRIAQACICRDILSSSLLSSLQPIFSLSSCKKNKAKMLFALVSLGHDPQH